MTTLLQNDARLSAILLMGDSIILIGHTASVIFVLTLLHLLMQYTGQAAVPTFLKTTAS